MSPEPATGPGRAGTTPTLLAVLVLPFLAGPAMGVEPAGILEGFPRSRVTVVQGGGRCLFLEVYVARDDRQRSRGLMFVTRLEDFEGMLFPYPEPAWISMWMKNTYIPLDMAFIRPDGTVAGIAAETTPLSLERITSPEPVVGVLELNGGFAARWGLRAGDRILVEP